MDHYKYLIIGGGMAGDSAVSGIREVDPGGSIGVFSTEKDYPYDRPPLTKGLWTGTPFEMIWRTANRDHTDFHLNTNVTSIDLQKQQIITHENKVFAYEKLLLATGGTPKKFAFATDDVIYYRTLADYHRVKAIYDAKDEFILIGGGFIASELAACLRMNGKKVSLVLPNGGIGEKLYPSSFSQFLNRFFIEKGVDLHLNSHVVNVKKEGNKGIVILENGKTLSADGIIAGLGITPNVELAQKAGLQINDGISVDRQLKTTHPAIFAAGDVANFYCPPLKQRIRFEHENCAQTMGRLAGRNMAGLTEEYTILPYFYTDLFDMGYEAAGIVNSQMRIEEEWFDKGRHGALFYFNPDNTFIGFILIGIWNLKDDLIKKIGTEASKEELFDFVNQRK